MSNFVEKLDKLFLCGMIKKRRDNNMRKQREIKRDNPVVTEKREILVFVYGSLKKYGSLYGYLKESEFVGDARIETGDFVMRDIGAYPALQKVEQESGSLIKGELYIIDHDTLSDLDKAEGFPALYNRKLIEVTVGNDTFMAWVYHIDKDSMFDMGTLSQSPVIDSGEWDAVKSCPVTGTANLSELGKPPEEDILGMDNYEDLTTEDDSIGFEVEGPVYINSEHGDYWGPFEDIKQAMTALYKLDPTGVNILTVGFRMIRKGLSDHELADIDCMTENISV